MRSVFLFFLNWRCWILLFRKRKFPSGLTFQYWICQSWRVGWITVKFLFFHWISKLRYYALSLSICWLSYRHHNNRHIIILTRVGYFGPSDLEEGSWVLDHLYRLMIVWPYFWLRVPPLSWGEVLVFGDFYSLLHSHLQHRSMIKWLVVASCKTTNLSSKCTSVCWANKQQKKLELICFRHFCVA